MRLHRFFVSEPIGTAEYYTAKNMDLLKQWRNVFRYTTGSQVVLFDGTGAEYLALIASITPDRAQLQILEKMEKNVAENEGKLKKKEVCLFLAVLKNNNFDLVLQKATEIGVHCIVPLATDRVIKKNINVERSKRILIEASEQSGRTDVVELMEVQDLKKSLEQFKDEGGKVVICQMNGEKWNKKLLAGDKPVAFVVGPEGGWSPAELAYFKEKKCTTLGIGEYTLRAETAAIGVLSLALLQ